MEIGVEVGDSSPLNDRETEIGIGRFEQGGEDNAAGGNARSLIRVNQHKFDDVVILG
jgi:hypothetical protein